MTKFVLLVFLLLPVSFALVSCNDENSDYTDVVVDEETLQELEAAEEIEIWTDEDGNSWEGEY